MQLSRKWLIGWVDGLIIGLYSTMLPYPYSLISIPSVLVSIYSLYKLLREIEEER